MCLNSYVTLWVKVHPRELHHALFGGHWSSASGDLRSLIFQLTSQDPLIEVSCNFMESSS